MTRARDNRQRKKKARRKMREYEAVQRWGNLEFAFELGRRLFSRSFRWFP